ncbi:hypothetical protein ES706_03706 [subsurface metagenome]|nr:methyltransferase domain-containing protein [Bacillota bacterium]
MDVFNAYAEEYDKWYERNRFAYLSELEALKRVVPKGGKGVEIGVGTGRFAQPLGVSIGLDPSKSMLRIAKKRGIEAISGKAENLPFADKKFSLVLIVNTLCFVNDFRKIVIETRRVLKDRGKIIIGLIERDSFLGKDYQNRKKESKFYKEAKLHSGRDIVELLQNYGFKGVVTFQTIFRSVDTIKEIESPRKGFGKGGFTVVCAEKFEMV